MAKIRVVRNEEFENHVRIKDCIPLVEGAFKAMAQGKAEHPAKYHDIGDWGLWFFMGGNVFSEQATAIKLGFAAQGVLTCQVIYYDGETGEPRALLEGLRVTSLRTGAAAAIGAKYMARSDAKVAAFVGAGKVCWNSLEALSSCFALEKAYIADISAAAQASFVERAKGRYSFPVEAATIQEGVGAADIVISATPSRAPIVRAEWVKPGTHISAMGSDGKGEAGDGFGPAPEGAHRLRQYRAVSQVGGYQQFGECRAPLGERSGRRDRPGDTG
ncbi:MAG: hypothetical protein ABIG68_06810 [Acidobacteriota bacterium]